MAKYLISGGNSLCGEIDVQGAKNSVLPLLSAAILTADDVIIQNAPKLTDVTNMMRILRALGAVAEREGSLVRVSAKDISSHEIPVSLAKELRSSIFLLGSVLARVKKAKVAYPGGCDIGLRPIDLHLKALREMGVEIREEGGYVYCDASGAEPSYVTLDYPSVGATENAMLLATSIDGVTSIANCAEEPEIEDLQNFINAMGGCVSGAGTPFIKIKGGLPLKGTIFSTMPDRIEAGTYLLGTLACGGDVTLKGAKAEHLSAVISKFSKWDCKINANSDRIHISSNGNMGELGVIETKPYPGFPTDLQAEICTLASISKGSTIIVENLFETRFKHVPELIKMGANVKVRDRVAVFNGVDRLSGAKVYAKDLRGGAALILAGLCAKGDTEVNDVHFVERGYEDIVAKLTRLGANIKKA